MPTILRRVPWSALAAGLVSAFAFAPWNILPAVLVGAALLYRTLRRRPEFAAGYLFGVGLLAPVMPWLSAFHLLAPFGVILISAIPYGLAARAGATPGRFAASFTAAEFARSIGTFALPWGVVGTVAATTPWRGLAALGGVWLISFLIWFTGAIFSRRATAGAAIMALSLAVSLAALPSVEGQRIRCAVVQGGFSMEDDYEFRPEDVRAFLWEATRQAAARGAQVVVWSETVILEYLNHPGLGVDRLQALADSTGVSLLVGAPAFVSATDKRNSAFLFVPSAFPVSDTTPGVRSAEMRYDKVHLVPFGEFLPGWGPDDRHLLLPQGTGDFSPAAHARPLRGLGPLICYEGALPNLARDHANAGAQLLVNLANDAWTHSAVEAEQHYRLSLLRAVETGRPLVRAGNVGRSALVSADGTVVVTMAPGARGVLLGDVILAANRTFYTSLGDWVGWVSLLGVPFFLTVGGKHWDH